MTAIQGFTTKKRAVAFQKATGGVIAYERDKLGRSKNKDHYRVAVVVGKLNSSVYPYCVYYEK